MTDVKKMPRWPLYLTVLIAVLLGVYMMYQMVSSKPQIVVKETLKLEVPPVRSGIFEGKPFNLTAWVASEHPISADGVKVFFYSSADALPVINHKIMTTAPGTGFYAASLPPLKMLEEYYYYVQATDSAGNTATVPAGAPGTWSEQKLLSNYYKRSMMTWLSPAHLLTMALAMIFLYHAAYYALMHLASGGVFGIRKAVSATGWGVLFYFITNFPIGALLAYAYFGKPWTGFPIVWKLDDADNRAFIAFIFFAAILWLMKGTLLRKGEEKNIISSKAFAWLTVIGTFIVYFFTFTGGHN
ncbi:MAG: hypothetical protein AAB019_09415 [Planctomycetota bacterium]